MQKMNIEKGYEKLVAVFQAAHDQAAHGKGKERHANGLPFHEQRMQSISKLLDSPDGMAYQVVKKMTEGLQFEDHQQREKELLGAINYLAGIVIYFREAGEGSIVPAEGNWPASADDRMMPIFQNGNDGAHYDEGQPWIEHDGGSCPVPPDTYVDVRLRDGRKLLATDAIQHTWNHSRDMEKDFWITHYRITIKRAGE